MRRLTSVALYLLLCVGCDEVTTPRTPCAIIPLTEGTRWAWDVGFLGIWSDTVRAPVILGSQRYFPLSGTSFGIVGETIYLRMNDKCQLLVWDDHQEKVFIDFSAPIFEPWSFELTWPGRSSIEYEVFIRSKHATVTYPGGTATNACIVEIVSELIDGNWTAVVVPEVGIVRLRGRQDFTLIEFVEGQTQ